VRKSSPSPTPRRSPPVRSAISKILKDDVGQENRVATRVVTLSAVERREEIARMLAGAEITKEARAAAKSLIEKAG